jgi:hypothetical protein
MPDHKRVFWTRCDAILKRASRKGGLLFENNREKGMDFHVCVHGRCRRGGAKEKRPESFLFRVYTLLNV